MVFGLRNWPNRGKELERKPLELRTNLDSITELSGALGISEADLKSIPRYAPPTLPLSSEGTKPCSGDRLPGRPISWTENQHCRLRAMWLGGESLSEMAEALGKTLHATKKRAYLLGLRRRLPQNCKAWTAEQDAELRVLVAAGKSGLEIGAAFGVTRNAAIGRAHRIGLRLMGKPGGSRPGAGRKANPNRPPKRRAEKPKAPRLPKKILPTIAGPLSPFDPPTETRVPFLETKAGQCKWICEDGRCCGAKTFDLTSWCPDHFRVVFLPSKKRAA